MCFAHGISSLRKPARRSALNSRGSDSAAQIAARPPGTERVPEGFQTVTAVYLCVLRLDERRRPVVHIEQNGVVCRAFAGSADDQVENIRMNDLGPRVSQDLVIETIEMPAVPIDNVCQQLGHENFCARPCEFKRPPQAVSQSEPANQDARRFHRGQIGASNIGKHQFRVRQCCAHHLRAGSYKA